MAGKDNPQERLDLVTIRARLEEASGRRTWQSLDELAETQEFKNFLHHEFPHVPEKSSGQVSRRDALKFMAASAAFAGLTACTKLPTEKIVPYVIAPEEIVPGKPLFYATAMPFAGIATGLLVESHMGRPTKIEGNPLHPASLGAADAFAQASILTLYDPDRPQVVTRQGRISTWSAFLDAINELRADQLVKKGEGLRILTETVTSPSLADQIQNFLKQFPQAKWHQYEPAGRDTVREGSRVAFGEYVNTYYRFDRADVILALDSDFLCYGPGALRYARDFADKRRIVDNKSTMNRLYVVESTPSNTGSMADHRWALGPREIEGFARTLAQQLGANSGGVSITAPAGIPTDAIPTIVRDLQNHKGTSIVLAGDQQSPAVHALAHTINHALGNNGKTVIYTDPIEANPADQTQSLGELAADIRVGGVETLIIIGGNPLYNAPANYELRSLFFPLPTTPGGARPASKVKLKIHLSLYNNETSELCDWHIPQAHYLESWGDARAYDGTVSIIQPLIAPLYDGKSAHELFAALSGEPGRTAHNIVHDYWKNQKSIKDYEIFWETSLHDGVMAGTAFAPKSVPPAANYNVAGGDSSTGSGGIAIIFRPDPTVWDGAFSNNGWLQELPKPITKLTWDNVAMLSPGTAQRLGVTKGEVVELRLAGRALRAPVWVAPGHADETITVHLGYGRTRAGRLGTGIGFNAYALRTSDRPWSASGVDIIKTGERYPLAYTQYQHMISQDQKEVEEESVAAFNRQLVRVATIEEFRKDPDFARDSEENTRADDSLYPPYKYDGYAWGMAVDTNSCIGCNACVVACQSENNIPVVGKEQVSVGRAMHWIRIDTYFRGGLDDPETYYEPVLCMHCENAPCEGVCPVGATVHSPEGLNEMVYNRCVGTRYCSNNCPYKVRRFNFELYSDWTTPSLVPLRNPNVTVRSRGVMEKCTYCVQRINAAKIKSELEDRDVRDGDIQTACQQSCPTQALVFGNINDPNSRVSKLKAQSRNYSLVAELNTRPRTTYLARLRNPNPEIKG
ncbi:MAG TPA: TAT-variant-translocated molybdopterin oxidoreductase [Terriglobia bacterium]|nr:TAT-variant-translocated molybdopterin oxidoreductase [Terriglobia bacterium]